MLSNLHSRRSAYPARRDSRSHLYVLLRRAGGASAVRFIALFFFIAAWVGVPAFAQGGEGDAEQYSVRVSAFWLHSSPGVTLQAAGNGGFIDFNHDFAFNDYSTFMGKLDWKFTRKNHLYFASAPFNQSNQVVLNRTITFRGQTYAVGATSRGQLEAILYAPGYQYDILRGKHGHLGIAAQLNIFHTTGTISTAAQVTGAGTQQVAAKSSASLLAPIPVAGPEFRLYLLKSRLFVNGQGFGMYLFGYGNYFSTTDYLGVAVTRFLSINAGYAIGSHLRVNNSANRVGLDLVQKGPMAGLEASF